jgi:hypothetical protein
MWLFTAGRKSYSIPEGGLSMCSDREGGRGKRTWSGVNNRRKVTIKEM